MNTDDFEAQCLSEDMGMSTQQGQPPEPRTIQTVTLEIKVLHNQLEQISGLYAIEIGRRLTEAKALLKHGQWGGWLKNEVAFSQSTANDYMLIFEKFGASQMGLFGPEAISQAIGNLGRTKLARLARLPSEECDELLENNDVASMSSRQLEQAIREKEDAMKEADQLEHALGKANTELSEREDEIAVLTQEQERADKEVARLKRDLLDLQNKPVEVAVEKVVDDVAISEAVATAKKEAEEALAKKIAKAETAKKKAEDAKVSAEQALAALKVEQERTKTLADNERQSMSDQIQSLHSKLAVASSSEIAIFEIRYKQGQEAINKMVASIAQMREGGDGNGADKLSRALRAMLEQSLAVVG